MTDRSAAPAPGRNGPRVLIAIPAYNEEHTIEAVVSGVRSAIPEFDLLIVNDGSRDRTEAILQRMGQPVATHLCNLGYGRAVQTAIKYAHRRGYDALITLDADGQHRPDDILRVYGQYASGDYDLLIGSRFVESRRYDSEPAIRRAGMRLFSALIALLTGRRVYDTSSGMKVINRRVFEVLASRPFVDFHAEAIVYLLESGCRVGESPITVDQRTHGTSMYTALSAIKYPVKVTFLIFVGVIEARFSVDDRVPSGAVLLVDLAGVLLIVWLFNLIRRDRLYVGYGAIFVLVIAAGIIALSIPALLHRFNRLGTLLTSASGLVVLAIAFVLLMLIYVLSQLTQLSNRVTSLAQELAIRHTTEAPPDVHER